MAVIKVSDFIAQFIASLGVRHVFLVSGGGNLPLIDSIAGRDDLDYVCNHHEQASAMAAEAYSRVSENIGVCITTFGPAATNTLTGVIGAWLDSIPVLYISGQVKRDHMIDGTLLRQLGVQEINIVDMARPVTKYAATVMDPCYIHYHLERAVHLAKSGRPGPVLLDIPLDVMGAMVEEEDMFKFVPSQHTFRFSVDRVLTLLQQSKRPVLFAGHGIRLAKARTAFDALIERLQVPVLTTMSAHDLISTDHPLSIGRPGVFGDRAGNFAIQNADLLISIGARHHLWNIGYNYKAFAANAKKVVVDID